MRHNHKATNARAAVTGLSGRTECQQQGRTAGFSRSFILVRRIRSTRSLGSSCLGLGSGLRRVFSEVLRRAESAPFSCIMRTDGQPGHADGLEDHERGGNNVGGEHRVLQRELAHGFLSASSGDDHPTLRTALVRLFPAPASRLNRSFIAPTLVRCVRRPWEGPKSDATEVEDPLVEMSTHRHNIFLKVRFSGVA